MKSFISVSGLSDVRASGISNMVHHLVFFYDRVHFYAQ